MYICEDMYSRTSVGCTHVHATLVRECRVKYPINGILGYLKPTYIVPYSAYNMILDTKQCLKF